MYSNNPISKESKIECNSTAHFPIIMTVVVKSNLVKIPGQNSKTVQVESADSKVGACF